MINGLRRTWGEPVRQRNYYKHIIRDENEWGLVHAYIQTNPLHWETDEENLQGLLRYDNINMDSNSQIRDLKQKFPIYKARTSPILSAMSSTSIQAPLTEFGPSALRAPERAAGQPRTQYTCLYCVGKTHLELRLLFQNYRRVDEMRELGCRGLAVAQSPLMEVIRSLRGVPATRPSKLLWVSGAFWLLPWRYQKAGIVHQARNMLPKSVSFTG